MISDTGVERDWTTKAGLRAICLWVRNSHRCGYVQIPEGHPCHGVEYNDENPKLKAAHDKAMGGLVGKRNPVAVMFWGDKSTADVVFNVHGGVTFSGNLNNYDGFWYGFDCAHCDDATAYSSGIERTEEFVVSECESLAAQLVEVSEGCEVG